MRAHEENNSKIGTLPLVVAEIESPPHHVDCQVITHSNASHIPKLPEWILYSIILQLRFPTIQQAQEMLRNDWSNSLLPLLCASTRVPLVFPTNQQCWKQCVRKTGETDGPHPPLVALPDGGFPGVLEE